MEHIIGIAVVGTEICVMMRMCMCLL